MDLVSQTHYKKKTTHLPKLAPVTNEILLPCKIRDKNEAINFYDTMHPWRI
jgi:hypothetical protein